MARSARRPAASFTRCARRRAASFRPRGSTASITSAAIAPAPRTACRRYRRPARVADPARHALLSCHGAAIRNANDLQQHPGLGTLAVHFPNNCHMVRSTIFWIHLVCGVATGLVVLMMSVTGVILTYERQILAWAENVSYPAPAPGAKRLTLEELVETAKLRRPEFVPTTIVLRNEADAPVVLAAGRSGQLQVDPYSGAG